MDRDTLIDRIIDTLVKDTRVIFAYLYGSMAKDGAGKDVDIAIYSSEEATSHELAADIKIALHLKTNISPDLFDIRIINGLLDHGDIFSLLYLKNVLACNRLLVDRDFGIRTDFLEKYGLKYRECEGLIEEVIA